MMFIALAIFFVLYIFMKRAYAYLLFALFSFIAFISLFVINILHIFSFSDNFKGFFTGYLSASSGSDIVFCCMTKLNTHIFFQVAAPFSHCLSCSTACTIRNREQLVFVEIFRDLFIGCSSCLSFYCFFYGDNTH